MNACMRGHAAAQIKGHHSHMYAAAAAAIPVVVIVPFPVAAAALPVHRFIMIVSALHECVCAH
jgi:hypothetical protein